MARSAGRSEAELQPAGTEQPVSGMGFGRASGRPGTSSAFGSQELQDAVRRKTQRALLARGAPTYKQWLRGKLGTDSLDPLVQRGPLRSNSARPRPAQVRIRSRIPVARSLSCVLNALEGPHRRGATLQGATHSAVEDGSGTAEPNAGGPRTQPRRCSSAQPRRAACRPTWTVTTPLAFAAPHGAYSLRKEQVVAVRQKYSRRPPLCAGPASLKHGDAGD